MRVCTRQRMKKAAMGFPSRCLWGLKPRPGGSPPFRPLLFGGASPRIAPRAGFSSSAMRREESSSAPGVGCSLGRVPPAGLVGPSQQLQDRPLLVGGPAQRGEEQGKRFGRLNDVFHDRLSRGFYSIHRGHVHQASIRPVFDPLLEPRPQYLKKANVFAAMVDVPARLPWMTHGPAIEMWDAMKPLSAYKMESVKRKRDRKMNKHKHRKKLKETRFLRRKLKQA